MRRLLLDLTLFALLASLASCAALAHSAPAPLEKRRPRPPQLVATLILEYGTTLWDVTLYADGSYGASSPGKQSWLGTWTQVRSGVFEVKEKPAPESTSWLRWRAIESSRDRWKRWELVP